MALIRPIPSKSLTGITVVNGGNYATVIDMINNLTTLNGSSTFTVGDITYTKTSTTIAMNKSGTIYYYGENSTQQIVAPTLMQYTANTVLTTDGTTRFGTFVFIPD